MSYNARPRGFNTGPERRDEARQDVMRSGVLHHDGRQTPVKIEDISAKGVRVALYSGFGEDLKDRPIRLELPGLGTYPVRVRWRDSLHLGLDFVLHGSRSGTMRAQIDTLLRRTRR